MGALIEAAAVSRPGFFRGGSVDLAVKAAADCLAAAGLDPNDVGILVNTGIYRDRDIGEPSIASFIQRRIGANEIFTGARSTFSFDLNNGGGGIITAAMIVDGFLTSGTVKYGLIVTSDNEPHPGQCVSYPFIPAGAALLLSAGREDEGFVGFRTDTEGKYAADFTSRIEWREKKGKERNILVVRQEQDYAAHCALCARKSLDLFLAEMSLRIEDIDIVIPSQSPAGWLEEIKRIEGMERRLVVPPGGPPRMHTAGPGFALALARQDGRFDRARNCLFLTVGAGITVPLALYRNPARKNQ